MKLKTYQINQIKELLKAENKQKIIKKIQVFETADLASLMASLTKAQSPLFLEALLTLDRASSVLEEMPEAALRELLIHTSEENIKTLFHKGKSEDLVYFLDFFNEERKKTLLESIPLEKQVQIQKFLNYPKNSIGRLMQSHVFSLPNYLTVSTSIETLRQRAKEEPIYYIYCTNKQKQLIGVVSMRQLATSEADIPLESLMEKSIIKVKTNNSVQEAAQVVAHYDFPAIPVVNTKNELVGLITKDEIIDVIQEKATADLYARAGLGSDDRIFTPALNSIKYRTPWICLNLLMAIIASSVISLFEETMSHLIILASLKNIVAGIGGNTAIQSLTVITRGLAMGDFRFFPIRKAISKELIVGAALGLTSGLGAGIITYFWKDSLLVSTVIFIAMLLNSLMASLAGSCIPIILNRFRSDPAVGSGVLATTLTDIFGFFSFLGIASLGLKLIESGF